MGNDTLMGGGDNDFLEGGTGADSMTGGGGSDTYYVDNSGDEVFEKYTLPGEDNDVVYSQIDFDLSDQFIENLVLEGSALIAIGNSLDNDLFGNSGNNLINGMGGIDRLYGYNGNDTYYVDDTGDQVFESAANGIDEVHASVDFVLGTHSENLILESSRDINGTGNALNNVLTGNLGDNVLNGMGGADIMTGGQGNDTYFVDNAGDQVIETLNGGYDEVRSTRSYVLGDFQEDLRLTGNGVINGTGNAQNNRLYGNSKDNVLHGGGGNDQLSGGGGADTFVFSGFDPMVGATTDFILDFWAAEGDQIDLSAYSNGVPNSGVGIVRTGMNVEITIFGIGFIYISNTTVPEVRDSIIW